MIVSPLQLVAAGLAAASVVVFCLGVSVTLRRRMLDRQMLKHAGLDRWDAPPAPLQTPVPGAGGDLTTGMNRRLSRSALGGLVQGRLVRAGLALRPSQFILIQSATAGAAALAGLITARSAGGLIQLLAGAGLGIAGFGAPLLVLSFREKQRVTAFEKQLPQAIHAMAGTLQAGSALPQAIEIIAREMPAPISVEFRRVLQEMDLGLSLTDSLLSLHERVRSGDLPLLTSAIGIQQRVGGDLAGMLRGISFTIRERLRIRGEIRTLTAQGRYSTYLITALPVALFAFMWFANNAYISQIFLPGITRVLLAGGIVGIVVGYFSMNKIVNIEV